ncbi:hypothetical protein [Pseudomonas syringae group genomosp. 3]|uniref:Uncharacterized protein n=1 Tax=Pseudomonas syringae pv. coriandricola TaxID=264453 RepID=A0A3M3JM79_9PSED|nr:hypothetical protein [Pseudomonas syringae group genomosp. 3]RMN11914.1 hypothetical protein ALQ65_00604 [Pseudomonas syringae pv. coriandricola]
MNNKIKLKLVISLVAAMISSAAISVEMKTTFTKEGCEIAIIKFKDVLQAAHASKKFLAVKVSKTDTEGFHDNICDMKLVYDVDDVKQVEALHAELSEYIRNEAGIIFPIDGVPVKI